MKYDALEPRESVAKVCAILATCGFMDTQVQAIQFITDEIMPNVLALSYLIHAAPRTVASDLFKSLPKDETWKIMEKELSDIIDALGE